MKHMKLVLVPGFLIIICAFLAGVKYGKILAPTLQHEQSIPMTATSTPKDPTFALYEYVHEGCGVSFLVPDFLKAITESSQAALLEKYDSRISISCEKKQKEVSQNSQTHSADIGGKKTSVRQETDGTTSFNLIHQSKKHTITFHLTKNLFQLVSKTLTFIE